MSSEEDDDERPIGDIIDSLGVRATVRDGELVAGAVVLIKVLQEDGDTRLSMAYSDGLGWIERAGMLHLGSVIESDVTAER